MAEEEGVSTEFQRLIDALVIGECKKQPTTSSYGKRPEIKPVITPEEIEEIVRIIYDAFHPLALGSSEEAHVRSLQSSYVA